MKATIQLLAINMAVLFISCGQAKENKIIAGNQYNTTKTLMDKKEEERLEKRKQKLKNKKSWTA